MITKVVRDYQHAFADKRKHRIQEALSITFTNPEAPTKYVVDTLSDGTEVYFLKPGKEYFRLNRNLNDMTPNVGDLFTNYSFADIWTLLCRLRNTIDLAHYKQLSVILYRVAFLLDFDYVDNKLRFVPSPALLNEIKEIQQDVDAHGLNVNILAFIHFMDILAWNDEMKTHANNQGMNYTKDKPKMGRVNTVLSCISIPILFQNFVEEVLKNKDDPAKIDFSIVVEIAQTFSRARGVHPLSNRALVELLSPYLVL